MTKSKRYYRARRSLFPAGCHSRWPDQLARFAKRSLTVGSIVHRLLVARSNLKVRYRGTKQHQFCRRIAEMAERIREGWPRASLSAAACTAP